MRRGELREESRIAVVYLCADLEDEARPDAEWEGRVPIDRRSPPNVGIGRFELSAFVSW